MIDIVYEKGSSTFLFKLLSANGSAFFAWRTPDVFICFSLKTLNANGKTKNPKLNR